MKKTSIYSLALFLIPPQHVVNGGIMSIFSLAKETRQTCSDLVSNVAISVYPGEKSYDRNVLFENDEIVFEFDTITKKYPDLKSIIIHIPDYAVGIVSDALLDYKEYLKNIPSVRFNIMNQNIKLMSDTSDIIKLYRFGDHITQTTAHIRYARQSTSDQYSLPLKHMSVFLDPSQYSALSFSEKKNLIAYSPDKNDAKDKIIKKMKKSLPDYTFIEIKNMSYNEYKSIVSSAKFVLTFGEGLDGYLIEAAFSGSIGAAVYNDDFFPDDSFKKLKFIYPSYEDMHTYIVSDIKSVDNKTVFNETNKNLSTKLTSIYSYDVYRNNLFEFYRSTADFIPSYTSMENTLRQSVISSFHTISKLEQLSARRSDRINNLETELHDIKKSISWRLTEPLRKIKRIIHSS